MKETLLKVQYPLFMLEIGKSETRCGSVDEILDRLQQRIEQQGAARYIARFDHLAHTRSLPEGRVDTQILDAKCILFCFGLTLPSPESLAGRPRSIGVAELADRFVVTFIEAPMPVANSAMEQWARAIADNCQEAAACGSA